MSEAHKDQASEDRKPIIGREAESDCDEEPGLISSEAYFLDCIIEKASFGGIDRVRVLCYGVRLCVEDVSASNIDLAVLLAVVRR